ncbi:hypothetical protein Sta7437_3547 [Stanieria cyanosphaera PCC 7437]|uniref:FAD-binding domain-containing protein n=2 Tax=Stanieria cyanosphaera TaxID=102116 RepID=K9XWS1_STAC7|nr:hypothetical protein Sta7437_3547 [Stanieria cyanosphaera PCC 7437]
MLGNRAIVIGGSITGLLTSRILTNYFKQVTIIERDRFPEQPEPRQRIPQSTQLHILLTRGRQIMEELFPGLQSVKGITKAPSITEKFIAWYMEQVIRLTTTAKNSQTTLVLTEVFHMLKSVRTLFHLRIVLQVLKQMLAQRLRSA